MRVGPRTSKATSDDERRLTEKHRFHASPFDIRPAPSATLDDLNIESFLAEYLPAAVAPEVLDENNRTTEQKLASVRLIEHTTATPTNLGLLMLGNSTRDFLPGAYIQFLRFDGTTMADPIKDQQEITGTVPEQLRFLDNIFKANIATPMEVKDHLTDRPHPDYPFTALQQLARNAVMHRNYEHTSAPVRINWFDDRIEIHSPGGPYGQVTRANFGTAGITDYRNPNLASALKDMGYVQRFGVGIELAHKAMSQNENPVLEFTIEDTNIMILLRSRS